MNLPNRKLWSELIFTNDSKPNITCPTCQYGILQIVKNTVVKHETRKSRDLKVDEYKWHHFDEKSIATQFLLCNNKNCKDYVAVIGSIYYDVESVYESKMEIFNDNYFKVFVPKYFYPCVNIIPLYEVYPDKIKEKLRESFSLFFTDISSCANKIRLTLEAMMEEFKAEKRKNLHQRINDCKNISDEIKKILTAIKWIGNSGSHLEDITKEDIFDAYEMLNLVLTKIYFDSEKEILTKAEIINKSKKPLSKK